MKSAVLLATMVALSAVAPATAADGLLQKRIIYIGNAKTPRAQAFDEFLRSRFSEVTIVDRQTFVPSSAAKADVVVLDWSQDDTDSANAKSPLGPREEWSTPTVLLGSAGHLLASPWKIIGGSG
jgi:hypothetical protein